MFYIFLCCWEITNKSEIYVHFKKTVIQYNCCRQEQPFALLAAWSCCLPALCHPCISVPVLGAVSRIKRNPNYRTDSAHLMWGERSARRGQQNKMLQNCGHRLVCAVPAENIENIVLCMSSLSEIGYFSSTSRKYIAQKQVRNVFRFSDLLCGIIPFYILSDS